jgi:hypothetical protein
MAIISAATGLKLAGGALAGSFISSGRRARRQERRATQASRVLAQRQRRQESIARTREVQMARAMGAQGAATGGTVDSSGFRGQAASIGSLAAGNEAFSEQMFQLQTTIGDYQQSAQRNRQRQQLSGSLLSMGVSLFGGGLLGGSGAASSGAAAAAANPSVVQAMATGFNPAGGWGGAAGGGTFS